MNIPTSSRWASALALSIATLSAQAGPTLYGVESATDGLSTIDAATALGSFVGRLDPLAPANPDNGENRFATPIAMAVQAGTNTLYAWNNGGIAAGGTGGAGPFLPTSGLVTIDPLTGAATLISTVPQPLMGALSFVGATLYGFGSGGLYEVDTGSGAATLLGGVFDGAGAPIEPVFGADALGAVLYALTAEQELYTVDVATQVATLVGTLGSDIGTPGSIVFLPEGRLLGSSFTNLGENLLFEIDRSTAAVSNIQLISGAGVFAPQGLGVVTAAVPVPGSPALLLAGLLGAGVARRSRGDGKRC